MNSCRIGDVIHPSPLTKTEVIDRYFLEHRAKLLDIASFLDRIDRAHGDDVNDYRVEILLKCIHELEIKNHNRVEQILLLLSDTTKKPIDEAGMKGATGAPSP